MKNLSNADLTEKADAMNKYLQTQGKGEPEDIIERIELLSIMISQAGEYLAIAKHKQDSVVSSEIMKAVKEGYLDKLSATVMNKLVSALAKEENYLVNQFDRINSSGVHQLDALRSVLSYKKAEFSALNYSR
jgi:hypothetical protein